jgi:hypothetical protein
MNIAPLWRRILEPIGEVCCGFAIALILGLIFVHYVLPLPPGLQ